MALFTGNLLVNMTYLLVGLFAAFYCWARYMHTYWRRQGVRSVKPHWFFGNLKNTILMRENAGLVMGRLYQMGNENDDVLGIYIFQKPYLLIRNLNLIKQILIKDFQIFPDRYFSPKSSTDIVGSKNLFNIDNPEWKYLRTKMSPAFSSAKMKKLFHLMVESGETMNDYLKQLFSDRSETKTLLIRSIALRYSTDVISTVAFGIKTNSFETPQPEFYTFSILAFKFTLLNAVRFFFLFFFPRMADFVGEMLLGNSADYFRSIFKTSMESRENATNERGDIIDSLTEIKNQKTEQEFSTLKFEGDVLLAQSVVFLLAGRETSVTTITFTLCELAKHPEIQQRVREEILEKLKPEGMTYEAVQDMKYLFQVISETLRMYPPAPIIDRVAIEDYKVPGTDIVIEKGTPVYVALCGLHMDPKYFPDPMRYDPDRFSDERKSQIHHCSYMPFGEGPRVCIGARLGMLQSAVALITILSNYEVSLNPLCKYGVNPLNVFLQPCEDITLSFKKIASNYNTAQ